RVLAGEVEAVLPVLGLEHEIAVGTKHKTDELPDMIVVLDDEDGLRLSPCHRRPSTIGPFFPNRGIRQKVDTILQIQLFPYVTIRETLMREAEKADCLSWFSVWLACARRVPLLCLLFLICRVPPCSPCPPW